jgi:hypothetical protein
MVTAERSIFRPHAERRDEQEKVPTRSVGASKKFDKRAACRYDLDKTDYSGLGP